MMRKTFLLPLLLLLLTSACELPDPREDVDCNALLNVETDRTTALANGLDQIRISVTLDDEIRPEAQVTFSTDYGSFAGSGDRTELTVTPVAGKAEARLRTTREIRESATVFVRVEDYCETSVDIATLPAYPDLITLESDRSTITANRSEAANLTVSLFREAGKGAVSDDIRIDFKTETTDGSDAEADVVDFAFVENETASVSLRSATDSTGVITVTACVEGADGTTLSDSRTIELVGF